MFSEDMLSELKGMKGFSGCESEMVLTNCLKVVTGSCSQNTGVVNSNMAIENMENKL